MILCSAVGNRLALILTPFCALQIMAGFEAAKHDKGVRSVVKQQVRYDLDPKLSIGW